MTNSNYKISIKSYFAPTPKNIRFWADTILIVTGAVGANLVLSGLPVVGVVVGLLGTVSKILSNFATYVETTQIPETPDTSGVDSSSSKL